METLTQKEPTLCGFREKDVITRSKCEYFKDKRLVIVDMQIISKKEADRARQSSFPVVPNTIYTVPENRRSCMNDFAISFFSLKDEDIDDLILLERPGHKFKVEDKVRFTNENPAEYLRLMEGEVIVIDPRLSQKSMTTYLVLFPGLDSEFVIPGREPCGYDQPWFPEKHNNPEVYGKAIWCGEVGKNRIEPIK